MTKTLPLMLVALLLVAVVPLAAAQEAGAVLQIPINRDAYNAEVSPAGRLAAVYVGGEALRMSDILESDARPDPALLAIRVVDLNSGERVTTLVGPTDYASDVAFTPDGTRLASYHWNGDLYLWDVASGRELKRITALIGGRQIRFLADGKTLVVYMPAVVGQFAVWDVEAGVMTAVWRPLFESHGSREMLLGRVHSSNLIIAFDMTPDGALLATATPIGEVALWDTATLEPTIVRSRSEVLQRTEARWLAFSADGRTLAYADGRDRIYGDGEADQIHLWDVESGRVTTIDSDSTFPALAPAGDRLAWWAEGTVWLADASGASDPAPVFAVPEGLEGIWPNQSPLLTFTADGTRLVVSDLWTRDDAADNALFVVTLP